MLFYLSVIVLSSLFAGVANTQKNHNIIVYRVFFFLSAVTMFVPLAMRDVGVDYEEYVRGYLGTARGWDYFWRNYLGRPEPLYAMLNYVARWVFGSFQGVNFLCALLSIFFTFAGISKFKDIINIGTSIWCFGFLYYLMMYGLNRMMISVAIITWTWHYYFERKTTKFVILSVIAGLFHYAAFLMIPFYFVLRWMESKNISIKNIKWVRVIISVGLIFVAVYVVVPRLFGGYFWFARYKGYFELSFSLSALNNNAATYLVLLFVIVYRKKVGEYLEKYKSLLTMFVLYIVLSLATVIIPIHRITYYFYPICVLLYGVFPASGVLTNSNDKRVANTIYIGILVLMGAIWLNMFLSGDLWGQYLVPYKWGNL